MKVHVKARNQDFEFECAAREKILLAGLRSATRLPYECASGTCGTCRAKLVEGEIDNLWPEAPGARLLKAGQGEFLMCQCAAKGDVSIEVGGVVPAGGPGTWVPSSFEGTIVRSESLTHDVMAISVALKRPLDFEAGQFVLVEAPGVTGCRGYSMVNFERHARQLEFVLKRKPGGGMSERLFGRDVLGIRLRMFGPLGDAVFDPALCRNVLCIAGGTGIAGMMAILARGKQEGYFRLYRGDVFFGVRTLRDVFFLEELARLCGPPPERLQVTVVLSEEQVPESVSARYPQLRFDQGMVHEAAARHMEGNYQNVRAHLAGPPPAVDAAIRNLLLKAKLTTDNILYDKFS